MGEKKQTDETSCLMEAEREIHRVQRESDGEGWSRQGVRESLQGEDM